MSRTDSIKDGEAQKIDFERHILYCPLEANDVLTPEKARECDFLRAHFCGIVITDLYNLDDQQKAAFCREMYHNVYICGDFEQNWTLLINMATTLEKECNSKFHHYVSYVPVKELCIFSRSEVIKPIPLGQVPIHINRVGVYFRELFSGENDYVELLTHEHQFQALTESEKPSDALRTGIYLTEVTEDSDEETPSTTETAMDADMASTPESQVSRPLLFNLLRCSSNLKGPTDNFRATDHLILKDVNKSIKSTFLVDAPCNHVLAQLYENKLVVDDQENQKERKARIKQHSDKTKDMPNDALIAFCTFYDSYFADPNSAQGKFHDPRLKMVKRRVPSNENADGFDCVINGVSVLTELRFRKKKDIHDDTLVSDFSVKLYPNSLFLIPLSTNRLYTHEIVPSILPMDRIPKRLGYVARCSNQKALFKNGRTWLQEEEAGTWVPLRVGTMDEKIDLKTLYFQENTTSERVKYGPSYFSFNDGDYLRPIL